VVNLEAVTLLDFREALMAVLFLGLLLLVAIACRAR